MIGAGSSSKVYLAVERLTNQKYSAKVSTDETKPENIKEFINQVSIMSKMNTPTIIKLIGIGTTTDYYHQNRVILLEYASNGNLRNAIQREQKFSAPEEWTITKKHIILYGIASAMSYIHSQGFIFCDLRPENILLDDFLYPKISNLSRAKKSGSIDFDLNLATPLYTPPEAIDNDEEPLTQTSDVYSFSILMYELMTNLQPFNGKIKNLFVLYNKIVRGIRPEIPSIVPYFYKELITRCWSNDPKDRPSFEEIKEILEKSASEINIDVDEFNLYRDYLKDHQKDKLTKDDLGDDDDDKKKESDDDKSLFGDKTDQKIKRVKIEFPEEELNNKKLNVKIKPISLAIFEKKEIIGEGSFGKVYKAIKKKTNEICAAKVNRKELVQCNDDEVNNLSREINILAEINSPLIVKFIGYNTNDFEEDPKPTIITEFVKNGSLRDVIDAESRGMSLPGWDQTKKLIIIYGVASGLAYLHEHDILHRDIKPENIFLDEFLFPKIGDFGLAKNINENTDSNWVGTPMFMSPEIINNSEYTKAGDVYAYGLFVYILLTLEDPFNEKNQFNLHTKVTQGYRPLFPAYVPECYQNLIRKCWSQLPEDRPTFVEIIEMIKENSDFINSDVDKDEFISYVESIDVAFNASVSSKSENSKSISKSVTFKEVSFDMQKIKEEDKIIEMIEENPTIKETFLDLNNFEKLRLITKGDNYKIYEVKNKETGTVYSAKVSTIKVNRLTRDELIHLSREVGIISQIKHPSFLLFIGYSPINFKKKSMPVIISELPINKSLSNLIEMERKHKKFQNGMTQND